MARDIFCKAFAATVTREIPGEYVTAGDVYQVTPPTSRKGQYHFWNVRKEAGTYMQAWQFDAAVKSGAIVRESI